MKAKREVPAGRGATPPRKGGDRRRRSDSPTRTGARRPDDPPARRGQKTGRSKAPSRESRAQQTTPIRRPTTAQRRAKNTSQAKARAKARKAKAPKVIRLPLRERVVARITARLATIDLRPRALAAKVPFVVLVIGSLGVGLGLTLWLSTDSAERSYQLGSSRQTNQELSQQKEALERDVLEAEAAPALAEAARNLGMIPSRDTAHLVQDPTGNWLVVGTPKPAEGVPPPPLNTKLPPETPAPRTPAPRPANSVEVPVVVPRASDMPTPALPAPAAPTEPVPAPAAPAAPIAPIAPAAPTVPGAATPLDAQHAPNGPAAPGPADPLAAPMPALVDTPPVAAAPPDAPQAANPPNASVPAEQFSPVTPLTPGAPR
jgi:cell division protein FtsB